VLFKAYGQRLPAGLSAWSFLKFRLIRLYPLFILAMALTAAEFIFFALRYGINRPAFGNPVGLWGSMALNLLFLPATLVKMEPYAWIPPAWSLSYELLVNVAWAKARPWMGRYGLGLVIAAMGLLLLNATIGSGAGHGLEGFDTRLFRAFYSFAAGLALGGIPAQSVPRVSSALLMLLVFLVLAYDPPVAAQGAYVLVSIVLILPFCVFLASGNEPEGDGRAAVYLCLGEASYAVYVLHWPIQIFAMLMRGITRHPMNAGWGCSIMAGIFVSAWLLNRTFDVPLRRWLHSKI
jgi:peptidoglycan/LPS O-acetylase OafA/YrhL